jgi:uncharacterized protein YaiI (UPF0178 family)
MADIYVDADACPVKDEVVKVAARHSLKTYLVSNGGIRPPADPLVQIIVVSEGGDVADDWIVEHIKAGDIVVTQDIPLADRCIKKNARALRPNGKLFTKDSIGMTLATRNLMTDLRESGEITGGPTAFTNTDRSQFLQTLETTIHAALRRHG